ncbi:hypothetical protein [Streptomyces meridianus]|uniref:Uncharacterized protein n=1 Tax=Streptomyces meridianus TaxID=2938945 RepID=A0ABT0XBX8_9ACTN|nr:hypothetical protein [Streptomyces meridianus]MCM2579929.1 hypothetical protein [Streptomyces meridianus]
MNVSADPQQVHPSAGNVLAPPQPTRQPEHTLPATDVHRIDLHAALIAAGVPPMPGDAWAVRQIAGLDSATVGAVVAWLETSRR